MGLISVDQKQTKTPKMHALRQLRLKTNCEACVHKCCSQPYDWVFLTVREAERLKKASGLSAEDFVVKRQNVNNGHVFLTLNLPCRFLDSKTGQCKVYESRPLVCRMFPFYPEPLTGDATLLPIQCGENLQFLSEHSLDGWGMMDFEDDVRRWLAEIWREAKTQSCEATSIAQAAGSP
jgi:Fe-S-cluster containining protein